MLVAITADLHLHKFMEFAKTSKEGVNDRLLDGINVLRVIRQYCKKHEIQYVIIAGDLFHKRVILDVETFNLAFSELNKFRKDKIQVFMLEGNHDQATKDGRIHSLEAFRKVGAIVTGRSTHTIGTHSFHFFPYSDDARSLYSQARECSKRSRRGGGREIPIMHHGFKGARVGSSLEYVVKEPIDSKRIMDLGWSYCFTGHYHARQWLQPNMMYIGSPLEHTRSDRTEEPKGFLVYDTDTNKPEVVPIKSPKFITVEADSYKQKIVEGNFVDVIVDDMDDAQDVVNEIFKAGARGVKPIPKVLNVKSVKKRLDIDPTMSVDKAMKRYVKWSVKNKKTDLPEEELIRVGKQILSEAS